MLRSMIITTALLFSPLSPVVAQDDLKGVLGDWVESGRERSEAMQEKYGRDEARPTSAAERWSDEEYMSAWMGFAEAMLARVPTAGEEAQLKEEGRGELARNDQAKASVDIFKHYTGVIERAEGPAATTAARDRIRRTLVFLLAEEDKETSALWAMLAAQDPIIAVREEDRLILTRADALAAARLFLADEDGLPEVSVSTDFERGERDFSAQFQEMPTASARAYSVLNGYVDGLAAAWPALAEAERLTALEAARRSGSLPPALSQAILGTDNFEDYVAAATEPEGMSDQEFQAAMDAAANLYGTTAGFTTAIQAGVLPF